MPAPALAILAGLLLTNQVTAQPTAASNVAPTPQDLAAFDKNKNGVLDADELAASRQASATPSPAAAATTPAEDETKEDTIMLSPFDVNVEKDDGFMGTNAGTATKLGLDLKDMAAPYSVITREFIEALNLTNLNDIGSWSTNGGVTYDGQGSDVFGSTTQFSLRGEPVNGGMQRNYFLTAGLSDSYNTERVDFGRGPNAVLFNVGANTALGGGVSLQTKQARTDKRIGEIALTVGSWDFRRVTVDYNYPLTSKFALRVNAVDFDREGYMKGEFQKTRGVTLAAKLKLGRLTELRAEVQNDKTKRSNPTIQFVENMSGWDGRTVYDAPITNLIYGSDNATPGAPNGLGQTTTFRGAVQGVDRQGGINSTPYYVYVPGASAVMNWQNMAVTRRADSTSRVPVYTNGGTWSRNGNNDERQWISGNPMFAYNIGIPQDWLARALANSKFTLPGKRATFMVDAPVVTETTKNTTLGFTHQIGERLFFDISGAADKVHQKINSSALGFRGVTLDINQNLPDGSPNPHYLQGYSEAGIAWRNRYIDNTGVRANLAYKHNAGVWGDYVFNLMGGFNARSTEERNYNLSLALNTDPRQWQGGNDQLRSRFYYEEGFPRLYERGIPTSVLVTDWATTGNTRTSTLRTIAPRWVLNNWNDRKEETKTVTLASAARYFDGKVVLTAGARVDNQTTKVRERLTNFADLPADPNWDGTTLDDRYWRPDGPADWKTLSYVPKNTNGTPRSPVPIPATSRPRPGPNVNNFQAADQLYVGDRFRSDYNNPGTDKTGVNTTVGLVYHPTKWISFKGSYGDSYKPADTGVFTLEGLDAEAQTGSAYDGKVTFSLFKERLVIGTGYYYNLLEYTTTDGPVKGSINNLLGRNPASDVTPEGRNAFGYPNIFGTDYQSRDNKGVEIEITGRITRGWRVSANLGTAKSKLFDRYPQLTPYMMAHQSEFLQVLESSGGRLDTTQKPIGAPLAPGLAVVNPAVTPLVISERDGAINDYNNIWINYSRALTEANTVGFKRTRINVFSDYTVQTGMLKGLRFGAGFQTASRNRAGDRGADLVPNPAYNPAAATSNTNLPYMDNPDVSAVDSVWVDQPINTYLTLGYTKRLSRNALLFAGNELVLNLVVNNPLNRQMVVYQDGTALRPVNGNPSAQYWESVPNRIGQYQAPVNVQFTARLKF